MYIMLQNCDVTLTEVASHMSRDTPKVAYKQSRLFYVEIMEHTSNNQRSANEGINGGGEARVQVAEPFWREAAEARGDAFDYGAIEYRDLVNDAEDSIVRLRLKSSTIIW